MRTNRKGGPKMCSAYNIRQKGRARTKTNFISAHNSAMAVHETICWYSIKCIIDVEVRTKELSIIIIDYACIYFE